MAYWNYHRCEQQADVYYSWMESRPVILQQQLIPNTLVGDTMDQVDGRISEFLSRFQGLHKRLILQSRNYNTKMDALNHEMFKLIG